MASKDIKTRIQETGRSSQRLTQANFETSTGASGSKTRIATFQADTPLAFRETSVRMVFITVEEFTAAGDGAQETFNLDHDLLPTNNTSDFVLYADGSRVAADAVDYANDSFDYTDDGTEQVLHAYYVARTPVQVEIVKSAPTSQGQVAETVYDDVTSILHERNQHKSPPEMDFPGGDSLKPMVPRKWSVDIYAKGPVPFAWDDSAEDNPQGTEAKNAVLSIPVARFNDNIEGLGQAVKEDIISP